MKHHVAIEIKADLAKAIMGICEKCDQMRPVLHIAIVTDVIKDQKTFADSLLGEKGEANQKLAAMVAIASLSVVNDVFAIRKKVEDDLSSMEENCRFN